MAAATARNGTGTEQTVSTSSNGALDEVAMQPGCAQGLAQSLVRHRVTISLIVTLSLSLAGGPAGLALVDPSPSALPTQAQGEGDPPSLLGYGWAAHTAVLLMAAAALQGLVYGLYDFLIGRPGSSISVSLVRGALLAAHAQSRGKGKGEEGVGKETGQPAAPWAYETGPTPALAAPSDPEAEAEAASRAQEAARQEEQAQVQAQVQLMLDSIHLVQALDAQGVYGHFWSGQGQAEPLPTAFSLPRLLCPCPVRPPSSQGTQAESMVASPLGKPKRGRDVMYLPPVLVSGQRVGGGWVDVALLQAAAGGQGTPLAQYLALARTGSAWSVAGVIARLASCIGTLCTPCSMLVSLLFTWLGPDHPSLLPSLSLALGLGLALPFIVVQAGAGWHTLGAATVAVLTLACSAGGSPAWGSGLRPDLPLTLGGGRAHRERLRHALGVLRKVRGKNKAAVPPLHASLLQRLHSHMPPLYIGSRRGLLSSLACACLAPALLHATGVVTGVTGQGLSLGLGLGGGVARATSLLLLLTTLPLAVAYLLTAAALSLLWPCCRGRVEGGVWAYPQALHWMLQAMDFAAVACSCAALLLLTLPHSSWLLGRGSSGVPSVVQSAGLLAVAFPPATALLACAGWRVAVALQAGVQQEGEGQPSQAHTSTSTSTPPPRPPSGSMDPRLTAQVQALNTALAPFFPTPAQRRQGGGSPATAAATYLPTPSSPSTWLGAWHEVSTPDLSTGLALAWVLARVSEEGKAGAAVAVIVSVVHLVGRGWAWLLQAAVMGRALQAQAQAQAQARQGGVVPDWLTAVYAGLGLVPAAPYLGIASAAPTQSPPLPLPLPVPGVGRDVEEGDEHGQEEEEEEGAEHEGEEEEGKQGASKSHTVILSQGSSSGSSTSAGIQTESMPVPTPLPLPAPPQGRDRGRDRERRSDAVPSTPLWTGTGLGLTGAQARLTPAPGPTPALRSPRSPRPAHTLQGQGSSSSSSSSSAPVLAPGTVSMPLLVAVPDPSGRAPFMLVPALTTGGGVRPFPSLEGMGMGVGVEQEEGVPSLAHPSITSSTPAPRHAPLTVTTTATPPQEEEEMDDVEAALAHLRSVRAAVATHLGTLSLGMAISGAALSAPPSPSGSMLRSSSGAGGGGGMPSPSSPSFSFTSSSRSLTGAFHLSPSSPQQHQTRRAAPGGAGPGPGARIATISRAHPAPALAPAPPAPPVQVKEPPHRRAKAKAGGGSTGVRPY